MKVENRGLITGNSPVNTGLWNFNGWFCILGILFFACLSFSDCQAVSSKTTRHKSSEDFLAGQIKDVVVGSQGTLQLGRSATVLVEKFEDVWSINSIVVSGGDVFVGTSPNGGIYRYNLGALTKIYPAQTDEDKNAGQSSRQVKDVNEPNDANAVKAEQYLTNEHIFAMTSDVTGRLLAGISGKKCRLMRLESGKMNTIFEPNDARYIFAIAVGEDGDIYLGTGPHGKVYRLDSANPDKAEVIYTSRDNNILSLAIGKDGFIYAGSDTRGIVYKIDQNSKTAAILYDSDQQEITSLLPDEDGSLYAAATSANITGDQVKFASQVSPAGRPEPAESHDEGDNSSAANGLKLKIANTKQHHTSDKSVQEKKPSYKPAEPGQASHIYKITKDGFVTDIFSEMAVFFCLARQDEKLFVGTGNHARLFTVEPESEQKAIIYDDEQASQITAVTVAGGDVYLGTANPARLIKLGGDFAAEGTYTSALIDAGQPAKWGKLQIEADVPQGCKVLAACRSGNVKDINDPTFSQWTEAVEITEPIQLTCPTGRFCQYKLILQSENGKKSPVVREVAVSDTVPNLAPRVESVGVERIESEGKTGFFKISYKAVDENEDKLTYKIDFRKIGQTVWIEMKDKVEAENFEWDGRTVEDGRYEVRVTASDERSNTPSTKLTGSRISEPVVVDNTPPVIGKSSVEVSGKTVTLKLHVVDELSVIGQVSYTVDSNADWTGTVPDDLVYDTTEEDFTIVVENLKPGEHIIAVRLADAVGNTAYKNFNVNVK